MVYWKDCASVTLAKYDARRGEKILPASGQMHLPRGYVLILIGDGGKYMID
jgi:hypothetical protein